jgi:hypothetical protein
MLTRFSWAFLSIFFACFRAAISRMRVATAVACELVGGEKRCGLHERSVKCGFTYWPGNQNVFQIIVTFRSRYLE